MCNEKCKPSLGERCGYGPARSMVGWIGVAVHLRPTTTFGSAVLPARAGVLETLAQIYTRVGDYESAIDQLAVVLSIPSRTSVALLRIDPLFDPLRDHLRFQALLAKYEN